MIDPDSAARCHQERGYPRTAQHGKEHIYVIERKKTRYTKKKRLSALPSYCRKNISTTAPGRVNLYTVDGIIKINKSLLYEIHSIEDIIIATRHNNATCKAGESSPNQDNPAFTTEENLKSWNRYAKTRKGCRCSALPA